jgi:predicted nucleotidyltransferase
MGYAIGMDFVRPIQAVIPGAQGSVLAVLTETTAELNLRTIARLSGVSHAQVSRVLPGLVELGVVERREAPPSSLFRLVPEHVAAGPLLTLARARDAVIEEMGRVAAVLPVKPESVIVFGSYARGRADAASDIDAVFVRPVGVDESDEYWADSIGQWRLRMRRVTGNRVEVLEVGAEEVGARLQSTQTMWRDIRREGFVVHGRRIDELVELHDGETGANQERERCPGTQLSVQGRGVPGRG